MWIQEQAQYAHLLLIPIKWVALRKPYKRFLYPLCPPQVIHLMGISVLTYAHRRRYAAYTCGWLPRLIIELIASILRVRSVSLKDKQTIKRIPISERWYRADDGHSCINTSETRGRAKGAGSDEARSKNPLGRIIRVIIDNRNR